MISASDSIRYKRIWIVVFYVSIHFLHFYPLLLNRSQKSKANSKRNCELEAIHEIAIKNHHNTFPLPPLPPQTKIKEQDIITVHD